MEVIVMITQLILGLSILVGVHELGHMLTAKYFGMRVEKFSIGFPPKIVGFKKGETEYSIGAIPLGGFVKISGMVDESMDTETLKAPPQPWEFRSKPAWQRLIVMLGGIIVNVLVAFIINIALCFIVGEEYISMDEVNKHGIVARPIAKEIGIETGDHIVAVNGKKINDIAELSEAFLNQNGSITISRNGVEKTIVIPANLLDKLVEKNAEGFIEPIMPYKVLEVAEGSNAEKGGLEDGDSIMQINGINVPFYHQFKDQLNANKNKKVEVLVHRVAGDKKLTIQVDSAGVLGFRPDLLIEPSVRKFTFLESIPRGITNSVKVVTDQIKAFTKIFKGELKASNSVGSFFSIGKAYGPIWEWSHFWSLTATLSMVLAFMNLLPIPALDGGHVMFLFYEIVSGKKPSDTFLENAQKIGMAILLALMLFAISNDVIRNFF